MGKRKRRPSPGGYYKSPQLRWKLIQEKCHPAMFEMAQLWKETIEALNKAGPNPSKETVAAIDAKFDERALEINERYPDLKGLQPEVFAAQGIFSEATFDSESAVQGISEWLYFERHKIPLKHDAQQILDGDWDASRRVLRTFADIEQLRCEKGPIRPFQGNLEHSNIFETMWGLGIEKLTQQELADYFNKYCPCGIKEHDAGALTRYRLRFHRYLQSRQK